MSYLLLKRDNLFEINHNSLIIWNNKLNRVEIDKVGMSIDVLPTVYNLFGIEYDSRLLLVLIFYQIVKAW